jgi:histidine ammonia-lyase
MMLLRANVLTLGFSGIRWDVIELLCEMLNRRVHPLFRKKDQSARVAISRRLRIWH